MAENRSLNRAKRAKNDEFYTQLEDIEEELEHYIKHFLGKVVYCNCDDPTISQFFYYFSNDWTFANSGSGQFEAGDDSLLIPPQRGGLFNGPMDGFTERFSRHGSTGLTDGRQHTMSPATRTALLHLGYEQTVRQHDQIQVPGLALGGA